MVKQKFRFQPNSWWIRYKC